MLGRTSHSVCLCFFAIEQSRCHARASDELRAEMMYSAHAVQTKNLKQTCDGSTTLNGSLLMHFVVAEF